MGGQVDHPVRYNGDFKREHLQAIILEGLKKGD